MNQKLLDEIRKYLLDYVSVYKMKVYLRGSRALGTQRNTSDVDIAILPLEPLPENFVTQLRNNLESKFSYEFDIIDLSKERPQDSERLLRGAIVWRE